MKMKWIFLMVLLGSVFVPTAYAIGFAVGPPSVNLTVPTNGENTVAVYLTSFDYTGEVMVGTEDIPFKVSPEVIQINDTDKNRRIELIFYGNKSVKEGTYSGKLTFLGSTDENVAAGVKIKANIAHISRAGVLGLIIGAIRANYTVILVVFLVLVSLVLGIGIGRTKE